MNGYVLDVLDAKKRQDWLLWSVIMIVGSPFLNLLSTSDPSFFFRSVIINLVSFLYFYHCAYKKFGTRLLTLVLCSFPASLYISYANSEINKYYTNMAPLALIIEISVAIIYVTLTLRLRNINRKVKYYLNLKLTPGQEMQLNVSQDYTAAMATLQSATTLDELNVLFGTLLRMTDHGDLQKEKDVTDAYNTRRKFLISEARKNRSLMTRFRLAIQRFKKVKI